MSRGTIRNACTTVCNAVRPILKRVSTVGSSTAVPRVRFGVVESDGSESYGESVRKFECKVQLTGANKFRTQVWSDVLNDMHDFVDTPVCAPLPVFRWLGSVRGGWGSYNERCC